MTSAKELRRLTRQHREQDSGRAGKVIRCLNALVRRTGWRNDYVHRELATPDPDLDELDRVMAKLAQDDNLDETLEALVKQDFSGYLVTKCHGIDNELQAYEIYWDGTTPRLSTWLKQTYRFCTITTYDQGGVEHHVV